MNIPLVRFFIENRESTGDDYQKNMIVTVNSLYNESNKRGYEGFCVCFQTYPKHFFAKDSKIEEGERNVKKLTSAFLISSSDGMDKSPRSSANDAVGAATKRDATAMTDDDVSIKKVLRPVTASRDVKLFCALPVVFGTTDKASDEPVIIIIIMVTMPQTAIKVLLYMLRFYSFDIVDVVLRIKLYRCTS